jgi:hypothetical protein
MQPELLIASAVALCVGFVFGYFVRAMVSWRRRRRSSRRYQRGAGDELGFRLERLSGGETADSPALTAAADAPSLAEVEDIQSRRAAKSEVLGKAAQRRPNGTVRKH